MRNLFIDAFEQFLLKHFSYIETVHIKDMFAVFSALYAGSVITLCVFLKIWVKANIVFENINDPRLLIIRFHEGDIYETQVRSDVFKNVSSILNVTFALIISNHKKSTKVYVWQVRRLEKIVTVALILALLLAVFGVMCALDTALPPGYKLPASLHQRSQILRIFFAKSTVFPLL